MISLDLIVGRCMQLAGKVWEFWGEMTGNDLSRTHGYQLVVIGQMRVLGGRAAGLLRYCTPRQALQARPVNPLRTGLTAGGRAP